MDDKEEKDMIIDKEKVVVNGQAYVEKASRSEVMNAARKMSNKYKVTLDRLAKH